MPAGPHYTTAALEALLNHIKNGATEIHLVDPYDVSDDRATVITNSKANVTLAGAGGDFTGPIAHETYNRRLTFDGRTDGLASADNLTPTDPYIVLISGTDVLAATNETSGKAVNNGDTVEFPSFYLDADQPVQE